MNRACSAWGGGDLKCIKKFGYKHLKRRYLLRDLNVDGGRAWKSLVYSVFVLYRRNAEGYDFLSTRMTKASQESCLVCCCCCCYYYHYHHHHHHHFESSDCAHQTRYFKTSFSINVCSGSKVRPAARNSRYSCTLTEHAQPVLLLIQLLL
jgi:hypothetical protein